MPQSVALRKVEVTFFDGTTKVFETPSFPWIYREWFCIAAPDETKVYFPKANVESYKEVQ